MSQYTTTEKRIAEVIFVAVVLVVVAVWYFQPKKKDDSLNVPLGVEQAAIVTYSGPQIAVTPYKWGVAVNVRIARVSEESGARIYDVRYIVNRAGTFDLKDYLAAADGTTLDGLPSFKFTGDPKLSKELDTRIKETEPMAVEVGGHYYATLAALSIFWIVWLLLLIFYRRPKRAKHAALVAPEPTLAELLRVYLRQLEAGTLDGDAKAKMEMLLLRRWRQDLAISDRPMIDAIGEIDRDQKTGEALRQLQRWLHQRGSGIQAAEIAASLKPFAMDRAEPEPEPASL
jgi:hypothetical protein